MLKGWKILFFRFSVFTLLEFFHPFLILSCSRGGNFCFCFFLFLLCLNFSTPFSFYQSQGVEIFVFSFFCFYFVGIFPPLLVLSASRGGNFCFFIFRTFLLSKFVNIFHLFLNSLLIFCVLYGFTIVFLV